jgi:tetratricopeptide (TPR) repeat protein
VFGVLFFFITLLPTFTNFFKGGALSLASDRYAYVPSIGLFLLFVVAGSRIIERRATLRIPVITLFTILLFIFTTVSHRQSFIWKDSATLYKHAIAVTPWSPVPYSSLGVLFLEDGKVDEGIKELQKAIELDPSYARAHQNLGMAYGMKGMYEEAIRELQRAIELHPKGGKEAKQLEELMRRVGQ